ncbi:hypothetical protein MBAV_000027 [Candidatus Magnetobacterium bavaricum]|uniref:Uncharacterized protein n=1 Tax=Candidatus Magnetobacterium bavaricum TaxID=29290 RepID=A0A0F3H0Q9_9BACT|nr:hypothetical protein MBAV_000027 [Candidatus Magnetobacterium bavaricum]
MLIKIIGISAVTSIALDMYKPIPVPSSPFVVTYGSKSLSITIWSIPPPLSLMEATTLSFTSLISTVIHPVSLTIPFFLLSLIASRLLFIRFRITCFSSLG